MDAESVDLELRSGYAIGCNQLQESVVQLPLTMSTYLRVFFREQNMGFEEFLKVCFGFCVLFLGCKRV